MVYRVPRTAFSRPLRPTFLVDGFQQQRTPAVADFAHLRSTPTEVITSSLERQPQHSPSLPIANTSDFLRAELSANTESAISLSNPAYLPAKAESTSVAGNISASSTGKSHEAFTKNYLPQKYLEFFQLSFTKWYSKITASWWSNYCIKKIKSVVGHVIRKIAHSYCTTNVLL